MTKLALDKKPKLIFAAKAPMRDPGSVLDSGNLHNVIAIVVILAKQKGK